jgi:hypothetical protein
MDNVPWMQGWQHYQEVQVSLIIDHVLHTTYIYFALAPFGSMG